MLRISGGKVYDPANGIDGVVKDICIADGKIVADIEGGRAIDAAGMVVFPGGVDVHTHVAGGALNFARGLVPENQRAARWFSGTSPRAKFSAPPATCVCTSTPPGNTTMPVASIVLPPSPLRGSGEPRAFTSGTIFPPAMQMSLTTPSIPFAGS